MYKLHHFVCFHQTNNQISGRVTPAQNIHQKENFAESIIFYSNGTKKHKIQRAEANRGHPGSRSTRALWRSLPPRGSARGGRHQPTGCQPPRKPFASY